MRLSDGLRRKEHEDGRGDGGVGLGYIDMKGQIHVWKGLAVDT